MLVLRAVFNILVRNASPKGHMCFRCLMFSLSGPCELLFLLISIASWIMVDFILVDMFLFGTLLANLSNYYKSLLNSFSITVLLCYYWV